MPLRIAFDLDGVLADMEGELLRQSKILFGEPTNAAGTAASAPSDTPAPETPADSTQPAVKLQLTARQVSRLWRHIATIEDFWESLSEIEPGVIAATQRDKLQSALDPALIQPLIDAAVKYKVIPARFLARELIDPAALA